jgi:hypothetical protein
MPAPPREVINFHRGISMSNISSVKPAIQRIPSQLAAAAHCIHRAGSQLAKTLVAQLRSLIRGSEAKATRVVPQQAVRTVQVAEVTISPDRQAVPKQVDVDDLIDKLDQAIQDVVKNIDQDRLDIHRTNALAAELESMLDQFETETPVRGGCDPVAVDAELHALLKELEELKELDGAQAQSAPSATATADEMLTAEKVSVPGRSIGAEAVVDRLEPAFRRPIPTAVPQPLIAEAALVSI